MSCKVVQFHNFISLDKCDYIIEKYGLDLSKSTTLGKDMHDNYRIAENTWIYDEDDEVINEIKYLVSTITGIPILNQEKPSLIKYEVGGEYKSHHDFFHPNSDYYDNCMSQGGNRVFSAVLYLNDDFTGGETEFPKLKVCVKPKKGSLCLWNSMDGLELLDDSLHAGLPVIEGTKWILIVWIRENTFT